VPAELSYLTPDQVTAYDAAWAACDDDLTPGWSTAPYTRSSLTHCLGDQLGVPVGDTDLTTFVDWLAVNEDDNPSGGATDPTDVPTDGPTQRPTDSPTDGPTD
jgi:hypothetical protein